MNSAPDIRFSVVIPAFNAAKTIVRSVNSCINQSLPPHEIIVVDDASNDDTELLLKANFQDRIIYIKLPKNSGPAYARNAGLALVTGSHIAFQDADDIWHKDKLLILQQLLFEKPDAAFIFHPFTLSAVDFDIAKLKTDLVKFSFSKLLLRNVIGTPCVILKYDSLIRFDEKMQHMEDYDLWLRMGFKTDIYFLDIPLTQIGRPVLSAGGQSSNRWKMRLGEFSTYGHLAKLNPLFILIIPFLIVWSAVKHLAKLVLGK